MSIESLIMPKEEKNLSERIEQEELREDILDLIQARSQEKSAILLKDYHNSRRKTFC
ncbi:MAG: hypothetical protein Q8P84_05090 [Deltaproteobacteria bacterium]|nr:hypothetical protein [Deltaproteobacteria bacterium]